MIPQQLFFETDAHIRKFGGRDRDRTGEPLLAKKVG
jgi:hypothetical protein